MNTALCRTFRIFAAFVLLLFALCGRAVAQDKKGETITAVRVTSTEFVIASDASNANPGYDRDEIQIEADVDYVATNQIGATVTYRMRYEIVDPDGVVQETGVSGIYVVNSPNPAITVSRTESFGLTPASALQPNLEYTVRAIVVQLFANPILQWQDQDSGEVGDKRFLHFTNTVDNDPAINVLVVVTDASFLRKAMVATATDPVRNTFRAEVGVDVYRYDNYNSPSSNADVDMNFGLAMFNNGNAADSPVVPPDADKPANDVPSYTISGGVKVPAVLQNQFYRIDFAPSGQLDSVDETHRLRVTVSHDETPATTRIDGPGSSALERLLHFNGTLRGGPVAATMTDIAATPTLDSVAADHLVSKLDIGAANVAAQAGLSFEGNGRLTTVRLLTNGDAIIVDGTLNLVGAPIDSIASVRFERNAGTLDSDGAKAQIAPIFPAGMGYHLKSKVAAKRLVGEFLPILMPLDGNLRPSLVTQIYNAPGGDAFMVIEESKPVALETPTIRWNIATGGFTFDVARAAFTREAEMAAIEFDGITQAERTVFSNDGYYEHVTGALQNSVMGADANNGSALLVTAIDLGAGAFQPHFPRGVEVSWTGVGSVAIFGDVVIPGSSSINGVEPIKLNYGTSCLGTNCGGEPPRLVRLDPADDQVRFTANGGMARSGTLLDSDVSWGYISRLSSYVHALTGFTAANFMMPGSFIDEADGHAGTLLHEGIDPNDLTDFERDGDAEFESGLGDYAGFNYRVGAGNIDCVSTLGGTPTPPYDLDPTSKYYVRAGGVSGIHDTIEAEFPGMIVVYGFPFDFDNFSLSYLSNDNYRSRTEGSVSTPAATEINLPFEGLKFDCLGAPGIFTVPNGSVVENLRYWDAYITINAGRFQPKRDRGGDCNPGSGILAIGVQAWASNLADPLHGTLLLKPSGEIVSEQEGDSRLGLPPNVVFDGPTDEKYRFTAVSSAYFNNHELADDQTDGAGFLNFAGKVDVPFFEDLRIHVQTDASDRANDGQNVTSSPIHFTGGWDDGDANFFEQPIFDTVHRGRPEGVDLSDYRSGMKYMTRARQHLLGVLPLKYPLEWNVGTRSFASPQPTNKQTLFVVSTEHQVRYLSPENVELDFGAKWEGVPTLNIANLGVKFAEDSGYFKAVSDAITGEAAGALKAGLDFGAEIVNDQADALFDAALDAVGIDDLVVQIHAHAQASADGVTYDEIDNILESYSAKLNDMLKTRINGDPVGLWLAVDERLADMQIAIRSLIGRLDVVGGEIDKTNRMLSDPGEIFEEVEAAMSGIFYGKFEGSGGVDAGGGGRVRLPCELGEIDVVRDEATADLMASLLVEIDPELAAAIQASLGIAGQELADILIEELGLDGLLEEARQGIESLRLVLMRIHNLIYEIRKDGSDLEKLIGNVSVGGPAGLQLDFAPLRMRLYNYLRSIDLDAHAAVEVKAQIKLMLRDAFNASDLIVELQYLLRQKLQDIHAHFTREVDSAFGKLNLMMFELLEEYLGGLDVGLPGLRGGNFDPIKAGKIDGYAHINGDALRHLRLDAEICFDFGEQFRFPGFFEIRQWDSEGDRYCSEGDPGVTLTEVSLGAPGVSVSWTGTDMVFDIGTKFSFRGDAEDDGIGLISGVGGYVNLCGGEVEFESMKIRGMNAAAAFGIEENYISAGLDLEFEGYELEGGAFFGRTCEIAPLAAINSKVADVLGTPPFTGAYLYGRAHMPIVNGSCAFRLSAGIGAGLFYFVEGPTYGGQLDLSASGEALCLVSVRGDLNLVGVKRGSEFTFRGTGRIKGKAGSCPFCVKFKKSVTLTYKNGEWDYDY